MTLFVIPDIHADPDRLDRSLALARPGEPVAFLGDLIDAGDAVERPDDRAVLERVRALVEAGRATAILGNHEVNALLYHRKGVDGAVLRERSDKNAKQHRSFVEAFGFATPEALGWTEWFLTLPLWRDLGGLRLVHACWDDEAVATVAARRPDGRLREEDLAEVAEKDTPFARAVERLVTGPEARLPDGGTFEDAGGETRRDVRLRWWAGARTWRAAALSVPDPSALPEGEVPPDAVTLYPEGAPPALCGHYKMRGPPAIETPRAACLDYPGAPVAYRWEGEARLDPRNLLRA